MQNRILKDSNRQLQLRQNGSPQRQTSVAFGFFLSDTPLFINLLTFREAVHILT